MSNRSLTEGASAFRRGAPRTANPHDADGEDWLCWRDGWEQARAANERSIAAAPDMRREAMPA